jgi:hypothetical protein
VHYNNITQAFSKGYQFTSQALSAAQASLAGGAGGVLTLQPAAAAIVFTVALPLQTVRTEVTLTERVPWTQLLANIVGLSGVVGFFGVLYGQFEMRLGRRAALSAVLERPLRGDGGGAKPAPLAVTQAASVAAPIKTWTAPHLRQRPSVARLLAGTSPAAATAATPFSMSNPLLEASRSPLTARGDQLSQLSARNARLHSLPPRAEELEDLPAGWVRDTDGEATWFLHKPSGNTQWTKPAAAV